MQARNLLNKDAQKRIFTIYKIGKIREFLWILKR